MSVPSETALGVAARLWCEPETEHITMVEPLAVVFATKVDRYHKLIEMAWGIIANASGGNWELETPDWRQAAERWRDDYHKMLAEDLVR